MEEKRRSFGPWLKELRRELGYTQKEIARCAACSEITLRKIEAGEYRASRQIAEMLAGCLGVPAERRAEFVRYAREGERPDPALAHVLGEEGREREDENVDTLSRASAANLPVPLTSLVGRQQEVLAIRDLLLRDVIRLVTLVGPPGIGKTRLGLHVARELAGRFRDGVYFLGLAPVSNPELVGVAMARSLGVAEAGERPLLENLQHFLRDRQVLLLLDNFEHVVEAAPLVSHLLMSCPYLKVLVTSQEMLHVQGEQRYPVPPLSMPDPTHVEPLTRLQQYPSVALFMERARAVVPGFSLSEENAGAVAAVCASLDGLPLAIELAAARVGLLSPQEMQARLDSRLKLLTGRGRDQPARYRTLRAALDWSYDLLDPGERRLFARLGVFVGGCTIVAVEAVCNATGDLPFSVMDGLASLLDKSLLEEEDLAGGERRLAMLEIIREYMQERLEESGERGNVHLWHAQYFFTLGQAAEAALRGPQQAAWLARLEREHGNLGAALDWAAENDPEAGLHLAVVLWPYWWQHGHLTEGRGWLTSMLERADNEPGQEAWRARALRGAGWLAYTQGDYGAARDLFEGGLGLFEAVQDRRGVANSLDNLGAVAFALDEVREARAMYERGLAIRKELGDKHAVATSLNNLGLVATRQEDYVAARPLLEESLDLYRELEDGYGIATSLNNLGLAVLAGGDLAEASKLCAESLGIRQAMADKYAIAYSLTAFGVLAKAQGEPKEAQRAVRLLGATQALLEQIGAHLEHAYRSEYDRVLSAARSEIGEAKFAKVWDDGQRMSLEQAIAYALENENSQ